MGALCLKDKPLLNTWIDIRIMLLDTNHVLYPH